MVGFPLSFVRFRGVPTKNERKGMLETSYLPLNQDCIGDWRHLIFHCKDFPLQNLPRPTLLEQESQRCGLRWGTAGGEERRKESGSCHGPRFVETDGELPNFLTYHLNIDGTKII